MDWDRIKTIPCESIDCELSLYRVPDIPYTTLREANRRTLVEPDPDDDGTMLKLVKISIVGLAMIGLTNRGHVLLFRNLEGPTFARTGVWEYVSLKWRFFDDRVAYVHFTCIFSFLNSAKLIRYANC